MRCSRAILFRSRWPASRAPLTRAGCGRGRPPRRWRRGSVHPLWRGLPFEDPPVRLVQPVSAVLPRLPGTLRVAARGLALPRICFGGWRGRSTAAPTDSTDSGSVLVVWTLRVTLSGQPGIFAAGDPGASVERERRAPGGSPPVAAPGNRPLGLSG